MTGENRGFGGTVINQIVRNTTRLALGDRDVVMKPRDLIQHIIVAFLRRQLVVAIEQPDTALGMTDVGRVVIDNKWRIERKRVLMDRYIPDEIDAVLIEILDCFVRGPIERTLYELHVSDELFDWLAVNLAT